MVCEEVSKGEMKGVGKMAGGCGDRISVAMAWYPVGWCTWNGNLALRVGGSCSLLDCDNVSGERHADLASLAWVNTRHWKLIWLCVSDCEVQCAAA